MSESPLADIFSSKPLVKLLAVLLLHPERAYYQQELVRTVGGSLRATQVALEKLVRADLVAHRREGRQVYYRAQTAHPAFRELQGLFLKTFGLADVLREALSSVQDQVDAAFVFGSIASAEQRVDSDVDLFVISRVGLRSLSSALSAAEERLGREISVNAYYPERLTEGMLRGDTFLEDVFSKPKIWVIGDQSVVERLARRRAHSQAEHEQG